MTDQTKEPPIQDDFDKPLADGRARPLPDGTIEVPKTSFADLNARLNTEPQGSVLQATLDAAAEDD